MRRSKFQRGVFVAVFGLGFFCASASDAQTLVITEFMANNDTTIQADDTRVIDEIRIGVTYADVTPIGLPPGALILVR